MIPTETATCHTFKAAVEMAVQLESDSIRNYIDAIGRVNDKGAREILRDAALYELDNKHRLERAAVEGHQAWFMELNAPVPTMNLNYVLPKKELQPDSDARDALIFAIHQEKRFIEFYRQLAASCSGATKSKVFERLLADESVHLQSLEDLYEEHFLTEN